MTSRRQWLEQTALAAAVVGLPGSLRDRLGATRGAAERPYLELALESARWIRASERRSDGGLVWPADPSKPDAPVSIDLYNGMTGVVVFFAELARATGDAKWLEAAKGGAAHLAAEMERRDAKALDGGLYTGLGGLAFAFMVMESLGKDKRYADLGRRAVALLKERALEAEGGVHWNGSHDIISGNAGIGLLLLEAGRRYGDGASIELAKRAGDRLIAVGRPANGGTMWMPSLTMQRNMPNFSHGAAGVSYFLATLHERTKERRYLDAALSGAAYLEAVAVKKDGGAMIHHHDGDGGENLFYLSWCHGPAGTARLFYRLHKTTGDAKWMGWVHALALGTQGTGIPEQRTAGYWNNISQCCGNVGVGEFFLDLSRVAQDKGAGSAMIRRVVDDTTKRATRDQAGMRWIQAEHRVQPDNVVAQTGYMQGAAGVGTFFLRLDAFERGKKWQMPFPDSPFAA